MIVEPLTPIIVSAVRSSAMAHGRSVQLRALELQLEHKRDIADIHASVAREFIRALLDRRIDAIQSGFAAILSIYAEQARGFLAQQEKYTDADLRMTDPLQGAKCTARLSEIDLQLAAIREDCRQLYHEMNQMLLLIGAAMPPVRNDDRRVLALPQ